MSISPGVVLAIILAVMATQMVRILMPIKVHWLGTLLFSILGLFLGELIAGGGWLTRPGLGVLHPLADLACIVFIQLLAIFVIAAPELHEY